MPTDQNERCAKPGLIEDHAWDISGKVWSNYLQRLSNESHFFPTSCHISPAL